MSDTHLWNAAFLRQDVPHAGRLAPAAAACYANALVGFLSTDASSFKRMNTNLERAGEDLWVFAYGSLMWRPDFEFLERRPARAMGAHRALCVYSFVHRGTPEKPGLVLGLDRGGNCRGIAYRVAADKRGATVEYLREREQVTLVYRECWRSVWLDDDPKARVQALCYMVDRGHEQYAGRLGLAEQLHYVRQGHGRSGNNRDYVLATVKEIEAQGCRDPELHRLAEMLKGAHEAN